METSCECEWAVQRTCAHIINNQRHFRWCRVTLL